MITTVLVPLDGSPLAEAALPYAKVVASRAGATLVLVRAAQRANIATFQQQHDTIGEAEAYLAVLSERLVAAGFSVQTGVPYGGPAANWIVEEAEFRHADLIIMATHDRVGPDRWVHGSVAERVVHESTVPVMLVRGQDAEDAALRFETLQPTIIVPVDGSELAAAAFPEARLFAQLFGARVVLAAAIPKPGDLIAAPAGALVTYVGSEHAEIEAEAWAYLEASVGHVGSVGIAVDTIVRQGDPATEIAALAEEYRAAAVVMATHGRTGLMRSILGSVAGGVLHRSATPVVLIHPAELRPAEQQIEQSAAAFGAV